MAAFRGVRSLQLAPVLNLLGSAEELRRTDFIRPKVAELLLRWLAKHPRLAHDAPADRQLEHVPGAADHRQRLGPRDRRVDQLLRQ